MYYDDLLLRMPREEATKITNIVKSNVKTMVGAKVFKSFEIHACGSYRRKKATCGDVDLLIT